MKRAGIPSLFPVVLWATEPVSELRIGERLPKLRGEFLAGREVVLPNAAETRVALLLLGFTYKSRFAVEGWANRFRTQFPSDPRVTFYEAPMIGCPASLVRWLIDSGMRRGAPEQDYEHVLAVYRGVDRWKRRVGFVDPDAAYLILLDRTGKVVWRQQEKLEEGGVSIAVSQGVATLDLRSR